MENVHSVDTLCHFNVMNCCCLISEHFLSKLLATGIGENYQQALFCRLT